MSDTTLHVERSYSFPVDMAPSLVTRGACEPLAVLLAGSSRCLIVVDPLVDDLHALSFRGGLEAPGLNTRLVVVGHDVVDTGVEA